MKKKSNEQNNGNSADTLFNLGKEEYKLGNFGVAAGFFSGVIDINPDIYEAYFYLAEAYKELGEREKANGAYQKFFDIKSPDQIELTSEGFDDYYPGLKIKEVTQHKGCILVPKKYSGPNRFYKIYRTYKIRKIRSDMKNSVLKEHEGRFVLPDGSKVSIPSYDFYTPSKEFILNVQDLMPGIDLASMFQEKKYEDKLRNLEWVVDATAMFGMIGKEVLDLQDVRELEYKIKLFGKDYKMNFYTKRFYDKVIRTMQIYKNIKISDKEKINLLEMHKEMSKHLIEAPKELYLFYTDANLRHFLEDDVIYFKGNKSRVDMTENSILSLGLIDLTTATEHELCDFSEDDIKYLTKRYWLNINAGEKPGVKEALASNNKDLINRLFVEKTEPKQAENFFELSKYASAQRHLTIRGDYSERTLLMVRAIINYLKNHSVVNKFVKEKGDNIGDIVIARDDMLKNLKFTNVDHRGKDDQILLNYLNRKILFDKFTEYKQKHENCLGKALDDIGCYDFKKELGKTYNFWKK